MKFYFSRHAKRRAKLYDIQQATILEILEKMKLSNGVHEIIKEIPDHKFPLKIVVSVEDSKTTIITNYPLKKGWSK